MGHFTPRCGFIGDDPIEIEVEPLTEPAPAPQTEPVPA